MYPLVDLRFESASIEGLIKVNKEKFKASYNFLSFILLLFV